MRRLLLIPALLAALGFASCGDDSDSGSSGRSLAEAVPADSALFVEGAVGPGSDQRESLFDIVNRVVPGDSDVEKSLIGLLDREALDGFDYEKDIEPWLGEHVGLAYGSADDAAFLMEAEDEDKAQDFVKKLRASGEEHAGLVDGLVVIAADAEDFKRIASIAGGGRSLAADAVYRATIEELPKDRLGLLYVDGRRLGDVLEGLGLSSSMGEYKLDGVPGGSFNGPTAIAAVAEDGRVTFDMSADPAEARRFEREFGRGEDLAALPKDAWLAISGPFPGELIVESLTGSFTEGFALGLDEELGNVPPEIREEVEREAKAIGRRIERTIDRLGIEDLFREARTFALHIRGTELTSLGLRLRLGLANGAAAARAVPRLAREVQRLIGSGGQVQVDRTASGSSATLAINGLPSQVRLVAAGKTLTLTFGDEGEGRLGDSEVFKRAQEAAGTDSLGFFLDAKPLARMVQSIGLIDPSLSGAQRYIEPFEFLAGGSGIDGDRSRGRLVIQTK